MKTILRWIDGLSTAGAYVSAFFMILIVGLILVEVAVRSTVGASTHVASEYSGYFLVALVLFGFAYTFREGAFIRIGLLTPRLPQGVQRLLDVLMALLALGMTLYALFYAIDMVYENWDLEMTADTMAETPFWIPMLSVPLGLALLALQLAAFIVRRVRS